MVQTKERIVRTFVQLLEEKPYTQITVREISEKCGITRNAFYYHFQDIPALLQEVLTKVTDQLISTHYQANRPIECLIPMVQFGTVHKRAILHIYRYAPKERTLFTLDQIVTHMVREYLSARTKELSIREEDLRILTLYYKSALSGMSVDWMDNGLNYDMETVVSRLCELTEGISGRIFARAERE